MLEFIIGVMVGASVGTASIYFLILRDRLKEANEWINILNEQERQIRDLNKPKAVTRLTNRERTVTL
jgi:hypothetical protein